MNVLLLDQRESTRAVTRPFPARHRPLTSDLVASALLVSAGALHLWLLPEHLAESVIFGAAFTAIAIFQLALAAALWLHRSDRVRRLGRWGSLAVVAVFFGARVFVPVGGTTVEDLDWAGVFSVVLELSAVAALAVGFPIHARRASWTPAIAAAIAFVLVGALASGDISYYAKPLAGPLFKAWLWHRGPNAMKLTALSPAFAALLFHHWSVFMPLSRTLLTAADGLLLAYAVHLTIKMSGFARDSAARFGLLGAAPAALAAPVCCGPSMLAIMGVGVSAALANLMFPMLAVSGLLLALDVWWLRSRIRRCAGTGACQP